MSVISNIKEIIESAGLPAERGVFTRKKKPEAYCTFLRLNKGAAICADDQAIQEQELYRITLFHKGNFETALNNLIKKFRENEAYINDIGAESFESETGYWLVPIDVEILKE